MREQRRDDRGLRHVLTRVSSVAVLAQLGVAEFFGRPLMRTTSRAENAIWDVMRAMVTLQGAPSSRDELQVTLRPSMQPSGLQDRAPRPACRDLRYALVAASAGTQPRFQWHEPCPGCLSKYRWW